MRILGLLMAVVGWLLAVSCVEASGTGLRFAIVIVGLLVTGVGVIVVLNGAHLKSAIWRV